MTQCPTLSWACGIVIFNGIVKTLILGSRRPSIRTPRSAHSRTPLDPAHVTRRADSCLPALRALTATVISVCPHCSPLPTRIRCLYRNAPHDSFRLPQPLHLPAAAASTAPGCLHPPTATASTAPIRYATHVVLRWKRVLQTYFLGVSDVSEVCCKSFIQIKVDSDVAHVAAAIHECCKRLFKIFHLFSDICCKCFI
jgi:hypothetical protein